jgi:hypothetical protein
MAIHSPADFSIWVNKIVTGSLGNINLTYTLRTINSQRLMLDLKKDDAIESLSNKPIRWLCYLLGDGSISSRKIEFSVSKTKSKKVINVLRSLGYRSKYRESKRMVVLTGSNMRDFAFWILSSANKSKLSKILDLLDIKKWNNLKQYATVLTKAKSVQTPCGMLRIRKERPLLYTTGNFKKINRIHQCLENEGIASEIYYIKGTYLLEVRLSQLNFKK